MPDKINDLFILHSAGKLPVQASADCILSRFRRFANGSPQPTRIAAAVIPETRRNHHPGKAQPYPGSHKIEALAFLRSRLALRLAGITRKGAVGRDDQERAHGRDDALRSRSLHPGNAQSALSGIVTSQSVCLLRVSEVCVAPKSWRASIGEDRDP